MVDIMSDWETIGSENNERKHMAGGILLSISLLFAGLAITVITMKGEEDERELIE